MTMKLGKLKISEIDNSNVIMSVAPQLISLFEQWYQFDYEYWRFEKERNFDYCEKIIHNEKKNEWLKWKLNSFVFVIISCSLKISWLLLIENEFSIWDKISTENLNEKSRFHKDDKKIWLKLWFDGFYSKTTT